MGVDSLAFDWSRENCWLVPPLYLISRVFMHFLNCQSRGVGCPVLAFTVLAYLIQENGLFVSFVVVFLFFQNGSDGFVQGANKETCLARLPLFLLLLSPTLQARMHRRPV